MVALAGCRQGIAPTAARGRGMEGGMEGSRLAWQQRRRLRAAIWQELSLSLCLANGLSVPAAPSTRLLLQVRDTLVRRMPGRGMRWDALRRMLNHPTE